MGFPREELALKFLRTYSRVFTLKEMKKVLNAVGISASMEDAKDFLDASPYVMELEGGKYITHAGAFTGEIFSIVPTKAEYEQGVFVPGHRCIPFVESDRITSTLSFYINGKKLPTKVGVFDSDDAIDMFELYGEEYAPQYIAADAANKDMNMADRDFELPNTVKLTGIDIDLLIKKYKYTLGDRLLCCVSDWDKGKLNIMVVHSNIKSFDKGEVGEKRLEWYSDFERLLQESFEKHGPLATIEDQLRNVFFENRTKLCVPHCGSVEEFMHKYARKIGFQHYGVETRLWYKNEDVPAFGVWNNHLIGDKAILHKLDFAEFVIASTPDFAIDQLILDCFYKKSKNMTKDIVDVLSQNDFNLDDVAIEQIALNLKERSDILKKHYNWFADQLIGPVRKKTLDLYGRVALLVHKIDYLGDAVLDFPSQEVVILAQLHNHLLRMIETVASDPCAEESSQALMLSLDGMEWNFEEIRSSILSALEQEEKKQFKILK